MKKISKQDYLRIQKKFSDSSISAFSGQAAFFMMLSFFPFMLFFFSLLKLTPLTENDFILWVSTLVPHSFEAEIEAFAASAYQSSSGIITLTIVTALWMSSKALLSITYGLNSMYEIKETRNYFIMRFWAVIYSLILAVVLIVMLSFAVFGKGLREHFFPNLDFLDSVLAIKYLIIIPILFLFFWVMYSVLPNGKPSFRRQWPGAIFASIGWIVFSWLFSIYANNYCNYASFYGTMTTIALIMVWLYACMYMVFLGGLFNSFLGGHRRLNLYHK